MASTWAVSESDDAPSRWTDADPSGALRRGIGRPSGPESVRAASQIRLPALVGRGGNGDDGEVMDARRERVARNEAMYRAVNREIEHVSEELGERATDELTLLCECGQDDCSQTIELTVAEYDSSHAQRDRFVLAPGHEDEQLEHVVERNERYVVVDKFGEAESITEAEERREGIE
jgi:hypothetical protein